MAEINTNHTNYKDPLESLAASLHGLAQRSKAISANIANINTQGYVRREVNFEDALQSKLANDELKLNTRKTDEKHLSEQFTNLKDSVTSQLDFNNVIDGANNVNVEKEMIDLTQTGLRFKAVSLLSKKYFENMRGIIRG